MWDIYLFIYLFYWFIHSFICSLLVGVHKSLSNFWFKRVEDLQQSEPICSNQKWGPSDFCLKRAERNLLCKSLPLGCVPDVKYIRFVHAVDSSGVVSWKICCSWKKPIFSFMVFQVALRFNITTKELKSADTIWSTRTKKPELAI